MWETAYTIKELRKIFKDKKKSSAAEKTRKALKKLVGKPVQVDILDLIKKK